MLLPMLILPLITSLLVGMTGRRLGVTGTNIIVIGCLLICALLSLFIANEIILTGSPVSIEAGNWLDTGKTLISWGFTIDPLNAWLISTVLIVSLLVHIFASSYMAGDPSPQKFMALLLSFTGFMVLLIAGDNLAVLFLGWEGIGITSYLLIGYWFDRALACSAAGQAIIVNRIGDTMFTLAIVILLCFWGSGTLDLHDLNLTFSLSSSIPTSDSWGLDLTNNIYLNIVGVLLVLAAAGKSAQFLLHTWLPQAMEGYSILLLQGFISLLILAHFNLFSSFVYLKEVQISTELLAVLSFLGPLSVIKKFIEIFNGCMLGDGHLQVSKNTKLARYSMTVDVYSHSYLLWLYNEFSLLCSSNAIGSWPNTSLPQHAGKSVSQYTLNTLRSFPLWLLHCIWYRWDPVLAKYVKIIPSSLIITPLTLCHWIIQDGYLEQARNNHVVILCTECYTLEEVTRLISLLFKLGLKAGSKKRGDGYRIRISSTSMPLLRELVMPHMIHHPEFMYKITSK